MASKQTLDVAKPEWAKRRRVIYAALLFCAGMVVWIVAKGGESSLYETVVTASFVLAGSVIGSYVFGAAWDDANVMKYLGPKANTQPEEE